MAPPTPAAALDVTVDDLVPIEPAASAAQ